MSQSHAHDHGHDHDHDHDHTPTVTSANERKVLLSFFLIFGFMVVEAVGGVLSGSLALLADAGHMLTDAAALALAYAAFRFGRRAADSKRTFGYLRFEVIAGFLNAVTLFAIVAWIAYEAWERLQAPPVILAGPMMIVAVLGLLVNVLVLWIMTRGETDHVNVKGAILHVMGDLLGSVGAIVAAIVIYLTGWTPIDPILSVLCGSSPPGARWPRCTFAPTWTRKHAPWSSASKRCFESNSAPNTPRSGSTGTRAPTRTSAACSPRRSVRTTAATITAVMTTAGTTTAAMIMAITSMAAGTATAMTTTIPLLVTGIEAARAGSHST